MIAEKIIQVAEITSHESEAFIVHDVSFCILVLVKTEQADGVVALAENLFRMSATSESDIYIDAFRL